ncbi:MAG: response regulator transcription factor [Clostridiales bacterium]|nr:response regulator transcription factor [Clostridiales bacterium]
MANDNEYKVLMIDDDEVIAQTTAEYFNMFDVKTAYVTSYDDAVAFLDGHLIDLLLLDINLGDKSGFDLCKKVREDYDMPIFFISARTSDDDVLIALNVGGDDYIKKPYTLNVLLAKVKTVLARYEKARTNNDRSVKELFSGQITDDIKLDTNTHKLDIKGESVGLKAMEYKLLLYLLENKGRVVTKDELLKNVWDDEFVGEGTLAVHIRHLREKIETDPKNPEIIKTIWGVGYMIEE